MGKIPHDKYYTPIPVANHCWEMAYDVIGENKITEVIEPSIGSGAFLHHPQFHPNFGYDIEPECESNKFTQVCRQDFLNLTDKYKVGRLVIGNPPYGNRLSTAQQFYRKATNLGDYIAFILPISQKDNTTSFFHFDLIYSEDLGEQYFSGRRLHCCFNVYQRPPNGKPNSKPQTSETYVSICRKGDLRYETFPYDFRLCYWGGNAGKLLDDNEELAGVYKIKVINPSQKGVIKNILADFPKKESISSKSISKNYVINFINKRMKKTINNATEVKTVASEATKKSSAVIAEAQVTEFVNGRNYSEIISSTADEQWNGEALEEDRVYHLNKMGGLKIYWIKDNRRTHKRALKMLKACSDNGMTTPAILVMAKLVVEWGLPVVDPATLEEVPETELEGAYCIMEGHGRSHGHLLDLALASKDENHKPFDFHFIYKEYGTADEFGKAYVSTNTDMTRTTNKDRLGIAGARCQNPLVKENLRKIREDHVIAKASYYWTYSRELAKLEVSAITYETAEAPQFNPEITEALQRVYEAFKDRFKNPGAEKIFRGVPAAQWVAAQLKDPATAAVVADNIIGKLQAMNETVYTALITAKTNHKKHITRDQSIKTELDKMMK